MVKTIAMVFGIIYLLVGIAGLISPLGGTLGMAPTTLLGIAQTNIIHNIVHLIIGVAGLSMAGSVESAGTFCKTFGIILLLIGVIGFFTQNLFGILPIGGNDIWIHLVSGLVLAIAGFATAPAGRAATTH
jgi:hypothetical protein